MDEMPGKLAVQIIVVALGSGIAAAITTLFSVFLQTGVRIPPDLVKIVILSIPGALASVFITSLVVLTWWNSFAKSLTNVYTMRRLADISRGKHA